MLNLLRKGYSENLRKAEKHVTNVEENYRKATNDMQKLKDEFDQLYAETEKQAAETKEEDLKKINTVSTTSNILLEEINKIATNLEIVEAKKDYDNIFIMMKRTESQRQSHKESLVKLETENTIKIYQFEPEEKLVALLKDLNVLGQMTISNAAYSVQMLKLPTNLNDIDIATNDIRGSVILRNQQLVTTDYSGKVNLIDTKTSIIVSEIRLPENLWDMTKVKPNEVAITCPNAKKIHFVSVSFNKLSKVREMSVSGACYGVAYNDHDQTFLVTFINPLKVEILNLEGSSIRSFDKDANGALLFIQPWYIALSPDQTLMYISDSRQSSVIMMTMQGEVKAVYKDDTLIGPSGICVNRSGIVYAVGYVSHSVHQIVPGSDKLELLLNQKDGLKHPITINYCDEEEYIYVGQNEKNTMKVFEMK